MKPERIASQAFNLQSSIFDQVYKGQPLIEYKRKRVRDHILRHFPTESSRGSILELNSGTGEDAIFFAEMGYSVHATDISIGMQDEMIKKINQKELGHKISYELCSFTQLEGLKNRGPYDLIFSNFAGLNCTSEIHKVLEKFPKLLKEKGIVVLVVLPKFCLWEFLSLLKGKFKLAFRRILAKNGAKAYIEGVLFTCWYYNPAYIKKELHEIFFFLELEGLCTILPPSYFTNFSKYQPKIYEKLRVWEEKFKTCWPWNSIGDYYILSFKKKI